MKIALLPAKPLSLAKTRLGSLLHDADRMRVAGAMFDDVLHALMAARSLDAVIVVTADRLLATRARHAGAVVVDERSPQGLNAAVMLGTAAATRMGATAVAVVLSDVPLVEAGDIDELVRRAPARGTLVVPSKEGTGTNAMLRCPPAIVPPCFGGRSLERHVAAADRARIECRIVRNARLELDLDTPDDLRAFVAHDGVTQTFRELTRLGTAMARTTV